MSVTIGILGGMGPRATVEFERRLLAAHEGKDQNLPSLLVVNNGRIPDRSAYLLGDGVDPLPELVTGLTMLENAGASVICIPCNTAHASPIFEPLVAQSNTPFLSMPEAVVDQLAARGVESFMVLGTRGTVMSHTYDTLAQAQGLQCIYPNELEQRLVDSCISAIKQTGEADPLTEQKLIASFRKQQPEAVVLACTELSLLGGTDGLSCLVIDSLDALVAAVLTYTKVEDRDKELV